MSSEGFDIEGVILLRPEQTYVIVDIEATGGSVGADERIIQIACVLIKNNQIINTFETLVNPGKNIPGNITKLTGISNKDVRSAPYFEEIAAIILRFLEDTVFVAHNVGFDYRFLNEQLEIHGFESLLIPAIDTVELTQILYPTMDSFQLEDIAANLGYDLKNAHDALADAKATVHIFQSLMKRALQLPLVTLEKLNHLAGCTTHDTQLFFRRALMKARKNKAPLADDLVVVNQIAIREPTNLENNFATYKQELNYPYLKNEKEQLLEQNYSYRAVQSKMMNLVYDYLASDRTLEKLTIEAPPGIGKSLGYLFPASFLASKSNPIIISTYTTVLQEQLLNETLPDLENILGREIPTTLLKSKNHYLSLSIFERWLQRITAADSEAYLSMRLLVWLTETNTGDLSEINAGSHLDLNFWQDIRISKEVYIDQHWEALDFYARIKESIKESDIIITNHHYLAHDWLSEDPIIPSLENIIIDEAHHFPEVAVKSSTIKMRGNEVIGQLDKMGSLANETGIFKFIRYLESSRTSKSYVVQSLDRNTNFIRESWETFLQQLTHYFNKSQFPKQVDSNFVEQELSFNFLTLEQKKNIKNILQACNEFIYTAQVIIKDAQAIFEDLDAEKQLDLIELNKMTSFMITWTEHLDKIMVSAADQTQLLRWVSYIPDHIENTLQFHTLRWGENNSFIDYLAMNSKVVFTSSTLSFRDSEAYFSGQLRNLPMAFYRLESPFNYEEQVRVMLPKERINPKDVKKDVYARLLAEDIAKIISQTSTNSIVLFRSLKVLEDVYHLLMHDNKMKGHLILAQSISGTRNRILKNFKRNKPAVILGADSFFEGIDLPDEELELVILTRLPFPAPNAPITRLKTEFLKEEGVHPFMGEFLPQAILKFKQAFGRLIRNKKDRGVLVILDDRFVTASYAKIFKEALPDGLTVEEYENDKLGQHIENFINLDKKK